jgi:hypothetical protein
MKESDLNRRAADHLLATCKHAVYYKHADLFSSGYPDSTFTWSGYTSWLEFKLLGPNESVHAQLDEDQLVELVKLQKACGRAWVIAFRKPARGWNHGARLLGEGPKTVIYSPKALLHDQVPLAQELSNHNRVYRDLCVNGVAELEGYDYAGIRALIHITHEGGE